MQAAMEARYDPPIEEDRGEKATPSITISFFLCAVNLAGFQNSSSVVGPQLRVVSSDQNVNFRGAFFFFCIVIKLDGMYSSWLFVSFPPFSFFFQRQER